MSRVLPFTHPRPEMPSNELAARLKEHLSDVAGAVADVEELYKAEQLRFEQQRGAIGHMASDVRPTFVAESAPPADASPEMGNVVELAEWARRQALSSTDFEELRDAS